MEGGRLPGGGGRVARPPFRPSGETQRVPEPLTPIDVVGEYFARMRAQDVGVVDLFHEDAELIGLGTRKRGRPAILEFYREVIERAGPAPRQIGSLLAEGGRVAAEILIEFPGGASIHALDMFDVEAGRIRSLTYFIASE